MQLRIETRSPTPLGVLASLLLAGLLAVAAFRGTFAAFSSFSLAWRAGALAFFGGLIVGISSINVRRYTFNAALRTLIVQDRWLGFLSGKRRSIPFADIAAVYLRSGENVYAVVVLRSGKKLYPYSSGTPRKTNRYCAAVKRITHVGRVLPAERRARGRASGGDRLASALFAAACALVVAEMLFCEKVPRAINVALIAGFMLVLLPLIGLVLWTRQSWRGGGMTSVVHESFRLAQGGICPNCGFEAEAKVTNCPACGTRLR